MENITSLLDLTLGKSERQIQVTRVFESHIVTEELLRHILLLNTNRKSYKWSPVTMLDLVLRDLESLTLVMFQEKGGKG